MIKITEQRLKDDPTTSYWLQQALSASAERDPIDAYNDANMLLAICKTRLTEALQNANAGKVRS